MNIYQFIRCIIQLSRVLGQQPMFCAHSSLKLPYNETNKYRIVIRPTGVLSLCALDRKDFNGSVVAVISGGNSDVFRMPEILERSLVYEGLTHYLKIQFPQRPGALKDFIVNILGPEDDIIYFKYTKVIHREEGPVLLGIQLKNKDTIRMILKKMQNSNIQYKYLTDI